jgi:hypothetical protein
MRARYSRSGHRDIYVREVALGPQELLLPRTPERLLAGPKKLVGVHSLWDSALASI